MTLYLLFLVAFLTVSENGVDSEITQICEVTIQPSQVTGTAVTIYLPENSSVCINCTATQTDAQNDQFLEWTLVSDSFPQGRAYRTEFKSLLQQLGYYQIRDDARSILLFINSTQLNRTNLTCTSDNTMMVVMTTVILQVNLSTYDRNQVTYTLVPDTMDSSSVTVSWRPPPSLGTSLVYDLTVSSENTRPRSFQVSESNFTFTAPPNASPCEVYNFFVTATPVGATYTGDGCSVASEVLRLTLPSLPNITVLESSLNYKLQSHSAAFLLMVHFSPASFCARYPVTAYVLQAEGSTTFTAEAANDARVISIDNLLGNEMYNISIIVSNTVGNVSTDKRVIYTTDVQTVTAVPIEDTNAFMVQCTFINSSQAMGCRVLLLGTLDNNTVIVDLTKDGTCAEAVVNTSYPVSNYTTVFGYDIELDGSIGTLAVPGVISDTLSDVMCELSLKESSSEVVVIAVSVAISISLLVLAITIVIIVLWHKRSHTNVVIATCNYSSQSSKISAHETVGDDKRSEEVAPVYEEPHKQVASMRTAGDGADHSNQYNSTTHTQESPDKADDVNKGAAMYAELSDGTEHFYHVLEGSRPPRGVQVPPPADDILPDEEAPPLPPPFVPDQESQVPPLPPAYQDISCLT